LSRLRPVWERLGEGLCVRGESSVRWGSSHCTPMAPSPSPPEAPRIEPEFAATVRRSPSGRASLTTGEETIDKEEDDCADHATKKTGRLSRLIPTDRLPEVSRNERAHNS